MVEFFLFCSVVLTLTVARIFIRPTRKIPFLKPPKPPPSPLFILVELMLVDMMRHGVDVELVSLRSSVTQVYKMKSKSGKVSVEYYGSSVNPKNPSGITLWSPEHIFPGVSVSGTPEGEFLKQGIRRILTRREEAEKADRKAKTELAALTAIEKYMGIFTEDSTTPSTERKVS